MKKMKLLLARIISPTPNRFIYWVMFKVWFIVTLPSMIMTLKAIALIQPSTKEITTLDALNIIWKSRREIK